LLEKSRKRTSAPPHINAADVEVKRSRRWSLEQTARHVASLRPRQSSGLRGSSQGELEDIAVLTGGRLISEDPLVSSLRTASSTTWARASASQWQENTTIVEGEGKKSRYPRAAFSQIRTSNRRDDSDYDREKLQSDSRKLRRPLRSSSRRCADTEMKEK